MLVLVHHRPVCLSIRPSARHLFFSARSFLSYQLPRYPLSFFRAIIFKAGLSTTTGRLLFPGRSTLPSNLIHFSLLASPSRVSHGLAHILEFLHRAIIFIWHVSIRNGFIDLWLAFYTADNHLGLPRLIEPTAFSLSLAEFEALAHNFCLSLHRALL